MASNSTMPFEISIPDFAKLSDEELTQRLIFFDGPWHPETKAAVSHFKARGLELNLNWANEAYFWTCPVCKRTKADIFRLTSAGNLKATLDWHHDHLGDFFKKELTRQFGREWKLGVADEHRHLERAASTLLARFSPTLICSDCNEIDGRIKPALSLDPDFSFSPLETARCIVVSANQSHGLDTAVAKKIWEDVRQDFEDRKALAVLLIDKMKAGHLKKEGSSNPYYRRNGMDFLQLVLMAMPEAASTFAHSTLADLRFRSVSRVVRPQKSVVERARRAIAPTEEELATISSTSTASRKWKEAPDDWCCPTCDRSKREVVRKSNKKKWFAAAFSHTECCVRPATGYGESRIEGHVDHHHIFLICGDCHAVMRDLRSRTSDADIYGSFLSSDQLRHIVDSMPHAPHLVDWDKATFFAAENARSTTAIEEYWEIYRHAFSMKEAYDKLRKRHRISHEDVLVMLAEDVQSEYPNDWSLIRLAEHLDFLREKATEWDECSTASFGLAT